MTSLARIARLSSAIALLLAGVWLFLPTGLGGSTTYVATHGTSMQPRFSSGDLAVLRPSSQYQVGDVVAYRSVSLHTTVMHRIVQRDGDRFVLQGDNNTWLDEDHPSAGQILGELWLRIPQGGKAVATLRSPWVLAMIGLVSVTALLVVRKPPRRSRGRTTSYSIPARARARQTVLVAGSVALLAGAGSVALLVLPDAQTGAHSVDLVQRGAYSYTGTAAVGTTYPTGRIATGDPIYTRLAHGLTVAFSQSVDGAQSVALRGSLRLDVSVAAPDGWTAVVTRGSVASVDGVAASASVALDPSQAASVLARHYAEIGAGAGGGTVIVTPVPDLTGSVAGQPLAGAALPALSFALDETTLRPAANALEPSTPTSLTVPSVGARTISAFGVALPLRTARIALGAVLVLALLAAAAASWVSGSGPAGAADDVLVRDPGRILEVAAFSPGSTVIDVADAAALHRVAVRLDTLVLHSRDAEGDTFAVRDGETTYRYRNSGVPRGSAILQDSRRPRITPDAVLTA